MRYAVQAFVLFALLSFYIWLSCYFAFPTHTSKVNNARNHVQNVSGNWQNHRRLKWKISQRTSFAYAYSAVFFLIRRRRWKVHLLLTKKKIYGDLYRSGREVQICTDSIAREFISSPPLPCSIFFFHLVSRATIQRRVRDARLAVASLALRAIQTRVDQDSIRIYVWDFECPE